MSNFTSISHWPAGGNFVVMAFHFEPARCHLQRHVRAQIHVVIRRRNREVAFLEARAIAEVVLFAAGIPAAFIGIDVVEAVSALADRSARYRK